MYIFRLHDSLKDQACKFTPRPRQEIMSKDENCFEKKDCNTSVMEHIGQHSKSFTFLYNLLVILYNLLYRMYISNGTKK